MNFGEGTVCSLIMNFFLGTFTRSLCTPDHHTTTIYKYQLNRLTEIGYGYAYCIARRTDHGLSHIQWGWVLLVNR